MPLHFVKGPIFPDREGAESSNPRYQPPISSRAAILLRRSSVVNEEEAPLDRVAGDTCSTAPAREGGSWLEAGIQVPDAGQASAHCGVSKKPSHSVHRFALMWNMPRKTVRRRRLTVWERKCEAD